MLFRLSKIMAERARTSLGENNLEFSGETANQPWKSKFLSCAFPDSVSIDEVTTCGE